MMAEGYEYFTYRAKILATYFYSGEIRSGALDQETGENSSPINVLGGCARRAAAFSTPSAAEAKPD